MSRRRVFGYARVSTKDQNLDRQLMSLRSYPVDEQYIFTDKASGSSFDRPGYNALLKELKPGDTLVIVSMDRLGRSFFEMQDQLRMLTREMGVKVKILDTPMLDTADGVQELEAEFAREIILLVKAFSSQQERDQIRQRQAEGIKAARMRGQRFGRPCILLPDNFEEVVCAFNLHEITRADAAKMLGVSPSTFDMWRKRYAKCDNPDSNNF